MFQHCALYLDRWNRQVEHEREEFKKLQLRLSFVFVRLNEFLFVCTLSE